MNPAFCTCRDLTCPNHPANHNEGCTRCIAKNLACREIPTCFFRILEEEEGTPRTDYGLEAFAALVSSRKGCTR